MATDDHPDRIPRSSMLRSGVLWTAYGEKSVRLRNLSAKGAGIQGELTVFKHDEVILQIGETHISATVAWVAGHSAGLSFQSHVDVGTIGGGSNRGGEASIPKIGWLAERPDPYAKANNDMRRHPVGTALSPRIR